MHNIIAIEVYTWVVIEFVLAEYVNIRSPYLLLVWAKLAPWMVYWPVSWATINNSYKFFHTQRSIGEFRV